MLVYTIAFFVYCRKKKATFETNELKISRDKNITKQILSLGFPSLIMTTMSVVQGMIVMYALNRYGTASDVAFYGVVYRIFIFLLTPIFGLMRALQPAMGINFGAKRYDRVISSFKVFAVAAFIMIFPFWLIMMVTPRYGFKYYASRQRIFKQRSYELQDLRGVAACPPHYVYGHDYVARHK